MPAWVLVLAGIAAIVAIAIAQLRGTSTSGRDVTNERLPRAPVPPLPEPAPADRATPADTPARPPAIDVEGIGDADERAAILEVARAIDRGGPFAYRKDGVVFQNREHRLPAHPRGHWREYTVPTPDSPDRGARRLIAGKDGELFYTRDHYRTFRRIRAPTR